MNFGDQGFDKKIVNKFFETYEITGLEKTPFENIISNDLFLKYFPVKKELVSFSKKKVKKSDVKIALHFLINVGVIHKKGLVDYINLISGKKTGKLVVDELINLGYAQKAKIISIFKKGNNDEMILVMPSKLFLEKMGLTVKGINHMFIKHTMITNYILLKAFMKAYNKKIMVTSFFAENTLKNDKYTQHLFSDGYLEITSLKDIRNKIAYYYEIDNGTEPISALLSKCIRYKRFFEDNYKIRKKNKNKNSFIEGEQMKNIIMFSFNNIKRIKEFKEEINNKTFIKTGFNGNIFAGLHQHYFKNPYFSGIKIL